MSTFELPEETYKRVLTLSRTYHREALKCQDGKAFLAGCVMATAALEAWLVAIANCYTDEATASAAAPRRGGKVRPIAEWSLGNLVAVARDRSWLPAGLSTDDEWDRSRARIGDYAEALRQIRNLIHPIRYAQDMPGKRITKRYLTSTFDILNAAIQHLENKLLHSLMMAHEEEEAA